MSVRFPLQSTGASPVKTPSNITVNPVETSTGHVLCRFCRDGTYATQTMQSFADEDSPWQPYCGPCGDALASVLRDARCGRDPEIRLLPPPPMGKAAPKPAKAKVEPTPKPVKGSKAATVAVTDTPAPLPVEAPKPPVDVRPRMSLAEAMRPTAPKPVPPPPTPVAQPVSAKSAKNALRDAVRDVEGYDLLTMLGMKR